MVRARNGGEVLAGSCDLEVSEARKTYTAMGRTIRALRGITVRMPHGEISAIIGTNGSGKSTLLQALGGLLRLDGGTGYLGGRGVSRIGAADPAVMRGIPYHAPPPSPSTTLPIP